VVSPHPVRLVVLDDLRRSRLTVFFRLLLAIPHYIWAALWTIAAFFAAFVNWVATLILGRSPAALHRFLAAYIAYITRLLAYLLLAANPYPPFTTEEEETYPIHLEIDPPAPQRRLITLFRIVLVIPALVFVAVFLATYTGGSQASDTDPNASYSAGAGASVGVLWTAAFFAWFACLALARMPQGFRNLQAYGLRYCAQAWAYYLVLTDRYPNLDPVDPTSTGPLHPVGLAVTDDLKRSRLTVFFRLLLALPHFIWLVLWGIAAFLAVIASWFATLATGRNPRPLHRFVAAYIRYAFHVYAFVALTANPFPGFTGAPGSYPVDPELPEPERQRRLVTLFRLPLALPAAAVSSGLYGLAVVAAFFGWFVALALGRMPRSLREAQAYVFRYGVQVSAYGALLTERYPYSGPSLGRPETEAVFEPVPEPEPPPEPFESSAPA
jgi:Domain of unknown function (DUF4389)